MTYRALLILIVYILLLPFVQGASLSFHFTRGACTERQISPGTYSIIIRDMVGVEWNIIGRKFEPKQKIKNNKSDFDRTSFKIQSIIDRNNYTFPN